jgi:hypothetical protein
MNASDAPPGTAVRVVWFGPDNKEIARQSKTVTTGEPTLKFVKEDTRSWKPGDYRAEVWVGDQRVSEQRFNIVSTRSARN